MAVAVGAVDGRWGVNAAGSCHRALRTPVLPAEQCTYVRLAGRQAARGQRRHTPSTQHINVHTFMPPQAFTASFTAMPHDTSLEGVAVHAERARRHAEAQRRKLERRREELLRMQAMAIMYHNRCVT